MVGDKAAAPWLKWSTIMGLAITDLLDPGTVQLCFLDCCQAGLAMVGENMEVLAASSWDSSTPSAPTRSFSQALINTLKASSGSPITVASLAARMSNDRQLIKNGMPQPFYKACLDETRDPAVIHKINAPSPSPPPGLANPPPYAHVMITVKINSPHSVPSIEHFQKWLTTNLPAYVGEIKIEAHWGSHSTTVLMMIPLELWYTLPDNPAYTFVDHRTDWDGRVERARLLSMSGKGAPSDQSMPPMASGVLSPRKENIRPGRS